MSTRPGHTLLELLIALAILGVVLGLVLGVAISGTRSHLALAARADARAQLQAAGLALAADLRPLDPAAGDIPAGTARDSALDLHTLVGTATVCDTTGGRIAARPSEPPDHPVGLPPWTPSEGDGAQILLPTDSTPAWTHTTVTYARRTNSACAGTPGLLLDVTPVTAAPLGTPLRITRLARWSLYHASDSHWYLGYREWNASLVRFDVVQPVAGPLQSYAASGFLLQYFDSAGTEIPPASPDTRRIARVDISLRAPRLPSRPQRIGESGLAVVDSERLSIALGGTHRP